MAVPNPANVLQLAPVTGAITHSVQIAFEGFWHLTIAFVLGLFGGAGLMGWFHNRGIKGMVTDVQRDVSGIKTKVQKITKAKVTNA